MARKRVILLLVAALARRGRVRWRGVNRRPIASSRRGPSFGGRDGGSHASTPIKHVVVIFQENVSFDHYFGTYPNAANTDGQTFHAAPDTPAVDGLLPATSRRCRRACATARTC